MLGKLIKYDLKFGKRPFLTMAAALIFAGLITHIHEIKIFTQEISSFIASASEIIAMIILAVVFTVCIVFIYQNFNRSMFTNEGYLTLTLPVKRYELIVSKLISSIIWVNLILLAAFVFFIIFNNDYKYAFERTQVLGLNWKDFIIIFIDFILIEFITAIFILPFMMLSAASNISIRSKRLGFVFGSIFTGLFITLEILFGVKIAARIFNGLAFWIVVDYENDIKFHITKSIFNIYGNGNWRSASQIDFSLFITLLLFGLLTYFITLYFLKKRIDLQ